MYTDTMTLWLAWTGWRNRLLSSSWFQSVAGGVPGLRMVARHHARGLFDLTAGFVYAQVTAAFVESGLFEALKDGPIDLAGAAARAGLPEGATLTLLRAAAALGLVEPVGAVWTLGARGAMLAGTPGVPEMIRHHRALYADLADPMAMLRGEGPGRLAALWSYGAADPHGAAAYSALMAASQPMVAEQALAAYRFARHHRMLDIGGGSGAFAARIVAAAPALEVAVFDLPAVAGAARERLGSAATVHAGDFRTDALPQGYDLVTLVRVLHDHDDGIADALLRAIADALPQGGRLLIVEPMAGSPGDDAVGCYFTFYLAAMRSGRPRTPDEICRMLAEAGFARARRLSTPLPLVAQVIVAER